MSIGAGMIGMGASMGGSLLQANVIHRGGDPVYSITSSQWGNPRMAGTRSGIGAGFNTRMQKVGEVPTKKTQNIAKIGGILLGAGEAFSNIDLQKRKVYEDKDKLTSYQQYGKGLQTWKDEYAGGFGNQMTDEEFSGQYPGFNYDSELGGNQWFTPDQLNAGDDLQQFGNFEGVNNPQGYEDFIGGGGGAKSGIYIKPSKRGSFRAWAKKHGYSMSEAIARGRKSKDPGIRKKAVFAANAKKWRKGEDGIYVDGEENKVNPLKNKRDSKRGKTVKRRNNTVCV